MRPATWRGVEHGKMVYKAQSEDTIGHHLKPTPSKGPIQNISRKAPSVQGFDTKVPSHIELLPP